MEPCTKHKMSRNVNKLHLVTNRIRDASAFIWRRSLYYFGFDGFCVAVKFDRKSTTVGDFTEL